MTRSRPAENIAPIGRTRRGWFAIGVYHGKCEFNIGTLWRSAYILGAQYVYTVGRRYKKQSSDTLHAADRHLPLFDYATWDDFLSHRPVDCPLVAIETSDRAKPLGTFRHPPKALYVLGSEDNGIASKVLGLAQHVVRIESVRNFSFNVATAGSIVMYDRLTRGASASCGHDVLD